MSIHEDVDGPLNRAMDRAIRDDADWTTPLENRIAALEATLATATRRAEAYREALDRIARCHCDLSIIGGCSRQGLGPCRTCIAKDALAGGEEGGARGE